MTKEELINIVGDEVDDVSKANIRRIYDMIFDSIGDALVKDEKHRFLVNGFGTFEVKHRAARKGRNPRTQEEMKIPPSTTVNFRPAQSLKDKVSKTRKGKKK